MNSGYYINPNTELVDANLKAFNSLSQTSKDILNKFFYVSENIIKMYEHDFNETIDRYHLKSKIKPYYIIAHVCKYLFEKECLKSLKEAVLNDVEVTVIDTKTMKEIKYDIEVKLIK